MTEIDDLAPLSVWFDFDEWISLSQCHRVPIVFVTYFIAVHRPVTGKRPRSHLHLRTQWRFVKELTKHLSGRIILAAFTSNSQQHCIELYNTRIRRYRVHHGVLFNSVRKKLIGCKRQFEYVTWDTCYSEDKKHIQSRRTAALSWQVCGRICYWALRTHR